MKRRQNFGENWNFHLGELKTPVPKITTKTGTCGGASNLTQEEGFIYRLHPYMAQKMRVDNANHMYHVAQSLEDEWRKIKLPHDWTTEQICAGPEMWEDTTAAIEAGYLLPEVGYYRKRFSIPKESLGKRIIVEFEGVMRDCTVWVNGCYLRSHLSGYTGFACDITEYVFYGDEGENVILVKADNSLREGWWAEGGGICRPVWLYELDSVHVKRNGVFVRSEIKEGNAGCENAKLTIQTEIENEGETAEVTVRTSVYTPEKLKISEAEIHCTAENFGENMLTQELVIENIIRWDLNVPYLYTAVTEICKEGVVLDREETVFGIRDVRYTDEGLILNGRKVEIKGVCVHQDFVGVGNAQTPDTIRYRLGRIKSMGANTYRSAHNPAEQEVLRACDEMGILVLNENRRFEFTKESREDLDDLIKGSRNHPCVFMWSLENEEFMPTLPNGKRLLKKMIAYVHKLDPTRPCTVAGHFACRDEEYVKIPDVAGFNYDMDDAGAMREAVPGLLTVASEDGSFVSTRGIYADDREAGLCDCYDSGSYLMKIMMEKMRIKDLPVGTLGGATSPNNLQYSWNHYKKKAPWLSGVFVWTAFDYRGETFPWNWPAVTSGYGAMDVCGFEKDSFYYWKSLWDETPLIHVLPHWGWSDGQQVQMDIYSNCEEVELILNGKTLGRKMHEKGMITSYDVTFAPGKLRAVAYQNGRAVTEDVVETWNSPKQASIEEMYHGKNEVYYKVKIVDEKGRFCADASVPVEITVKGGKIIGLGNGNPTNHEPVRLEDFRTFQGLGLIMVHCEEYGAVTVTAKLSEK